MIFPSLDDNSTQSAVYLILLLCLILAGSAGYLRARPKTALKHFLLWGIIVTSLITVYGFRSEFRVIKERFLAEIFPSRMTLGHDGSISIRASQDNHYYIAGKINDMPITFLIDTGASDIVISPDDAKRLGLSNQRLVYNKIFETANGQVRGASVFVKTLTVGPLQLNDFYVTINEAAMDKSLLGMRFLHQLRAYKVEDGVLTMWP